MPLSLDDQKLLLEGVHDATIKEVEDTFGDFQRTDKRLKLFAKLVTYIGDLRRANIAVSIIVDGSFVMGDVDEPGDIDVILVLPKSWDMTADLSPYHYNLVSKKAVKRNFPFDVIPVREGSKEEAYWSDYFCQVNVKWFEPLGLPEGRRKGIVRIAL